MCFLDLCSGFQLYLLGFFSVISQKQIRSCGFITFLSPEASYWFWFQLERVFFVMLFISLWLSITSIFFHTPLPLILAVTRSIQFPGVFHFKWSESCFPPCLSPSLHISTLSLALKWDGKKCPHKQYVYLTMFLWRSNMWKCTHRDSIWYKDNKRVFYLRIFTISALDNKALTWEGPTPCCGSGRCRRV